MSCCSMLNIHLLTGLTVPSPVQCAQSDVQHLECRQLHQILVLLVQLFLHDGHVI